MHPDPSIDRSGDPDSIQHSLSHRDRRQANRRCPDFPEKLGSWRASEPWLDEANDVRELAEKAWDYVERDQARRRHAAYDGTPAFGGACFASGRTRLSLYNTGEPIDRRSIFLFQNNQGSGRTNQSCESTS